MKTTIKVKSILSYDGSQFFGFAPQIGKKTVITTIQTALANIGINTIVLGSSRTDKGVHATNQVVSFEVPLYWLDTIKLKNILNKQLPNSIKIKKINQIAHNFNPRFDAKMREYRYLLTTNTTPFNSNFITFHKNIDCQKLSNAIKIFEGEWDFKYFYKTGGSHNTTVKTIYKTWCYKYKNIVVLKFRANAYLRSQIRLMVAFLLDINDGKKNNNDLISQLKKIDKYITKPASPNGLYLSKVFY